MEDNTNISISDHVGVTEGGPVDGKEEPMTASQASQLKTLSSEAGVPVDLGLNRRDAAKKIADLQAKMVRGTPGDA